MKFAIVDDDVQITKKLNQYIEKFELQNNIRIKTVVFFNPVEFIESYCNDYDLIILDIEMPGLNGIETAREIRRLDPNVLIMFVTNVAQYAIQGYEVEAIDYVLKPVSFPDFAMKIQKALRYIDRNYDQKITLNSQEGIVTLKISDIYYIEVIRHYLVYHTVYGQYTVRGVMKEAENLYGHLYFVRSNQCYLINLKYVTSIQANTVKIGTDELQISRNRKKDFMSAFTRYIGGMKS